MKKFRLLSSCLLFLTIFGCSNISKIQNMTIEERKNKADSYFEQEKYRKAIEYYESIALERNSIHTAQSQLKLADSYFLMGNYIDARFEYEEMIRLFPDHKEIERAYFNIAICYMEESLEPNLTQTETLLSIDSFRIYLEKFPFSSRKDEIFQHINKLNYKLLEKKFLNGYIYYKIKDYSAALMYFDEILELGNVNAVDKSSLYYSALIYIYRKDSNLSNQTISRLVEKYPESKETTKILKLKNKLDKKKKSND